MYLHLFLLLFSSGVSSYFLPLKELPHWQNKAKYSIIDEMLCLLEAEKEPINEQFSIPLHVQNKSCAHKNTEKFIHELKKIPACKCMKKVEKDMKRLKEHCSVLRNSSTNNERCLDTAKTNFSKFKESLRKFLEWINSKQNCSNITRSESGLYPDSKCSCHDLWKYRRGLL